MNNERPSSRSFFGMHGMIIGLTAYAFIAATIGDAISDWHLSLLSIYYLIAGVAWIYPAIKLLRWMANGHNQQHTANTNSSIKKE